MIPAARWARHGLSAEDEAGLAPGEAPRDPEELEARAVATSLEISGLTTLGAVHLTVSDLERSLDYYTRSIGLVLREHGGGQASLGTDTRDLLVLVEERGARPSGGHCGLYHFALLVPQRSDLASWLAHASEEQVRFVGAADHFVSEALYLSDPDRHGIEIYWDRPRQFWEGQVASKMTSLPLDMTGLLGELEGSPSEAFGTLPPGTVMGHVHLKVAAIPETIAFYRDGLGMGLMAQLSGQAAFLSAGGYHHHIGTNTWESSGATPAPIGTARLKGATILLPDSAERGRLIDRLRRGGYTPDESGASPTVRDPSGNTLLLAVP